MYTNDHQHRESSEFWGGTNHYFILKIFFKTRLVKLFKNEIFHSNCEKSTQHSWNINQKTIQNTWNKQSKIHPTSIKNPPKIHQKSTKNRSKIHQKSILEASWGLLGGLERLGGLLGASWGVLGASWGVLVASWAVLGGQHGSKLTPKMETKSIKNRSQNQRFLKWLLGSDFCKILVNFGTKMKPSWPSKLSPNRCEHQKAIFWKITRFSLR